VAVPAAKAIPLGANAYGRCGAIEWAANNFVENSGNEPVYWRNLHQVTVAGPGWFEFDGAGTSWWDSWGDGFLSGADVRIYRIVDQVGNSVCTNGNRPDMSRADHVALVGKTQVLPAGSPGFAQGGWVVTKFGPVQPHTSIRWGNLAATDATSLENGTPYWYSVVACGPDGKNSELAAEVSATPQAGAQDGPHLLPLSQDDALPPLRQGTPFSVVPKVIAGKPPLAWALSTPLPGGLQIDPQTGRIFGTPLENAVPNLPLQVVVTDAEGRRDTRRWLFNPTPPEPATPGTAKLEPPTHLKAVAGDGCVTISWDPSPTPGVVYSLRRSTRPLAKQENRVYVAKDAPAIEPFDTVIIERKFDPFDMALVHPRVRGIGNPMDKPAWYWRGDLERLRFSLVPHPQPIPPEMNEPGQTCMEVEAKSPGDFAINQLVFCGTDHVKEALWYGQLEPGKHYCLEVWMRQEGLQNGGRVGFSYGNEDPHSPPVLAGIAADFAVTGTWQKFTYAFTAPDRPAAPLHYGHRFTFTGPGKLWLDNARIARIDRPEDLAKPYLPNATVFNELLAAMPKDGPKGAHRCPVLSRDLTMDSLLSWHGNSKVRPSWHTSISSNGDVMMLPAALEWSFLSGDKPATRLVPWLTIQHLLHSEEDWLALVEYLAAPYDPKTDSPKTKPWAFRRVQQRGTTTPWTNEFRELVIEFGNETWHNASFEDWIGFGGFGAIWKGGKAYGLFSRHLIETMQSSPYWKEQKLAGKIRFALGDGYIFNGEGLSYGEEAMQTCPQADILARANYVGPKWETGDASKGVFDDEGIQETLLAHQTGEKENFTKKQATRDAMALAGHAYDIAAYEGGPSGYGLPSSTGPALVEVCEKYGKSLAMGVAALDAWLDSSLRGWTYQMFSSYGQGVFWNSHTPLWDGFRPTPGWLAMVLRNRFASGDMVVVDEVACPTLKRLGKEIPLVGCYAFRDGNRWSIFLLSRKLGGTYRGEDQGSGVIPVTLDLPFKKAGKITLHKLVGDPRDNNRTTMKLDIQTAEIPPATLDSQTGTFSLNPTTGATQGGLPPGSILLYVFEDATPTP
jgi:hypothetical protein